MTENKTQKIVKHRIGRLLSIKELAAELGRGRTYVHAMKRDGFPMPGNRARLSAAEAWLAANPDFRANRPIRKKNKIGT